MKTRKLSASAALKLIKERESMFVDAILHCPYHTCPVTDRPQVHPNYGFLKQLDVFAECAYEPTPTHPAYLAWKLRQGQNVTRFLNQLLDTVSIIPDELYLSR